MLNAFVSLKHSKNADIMCKSIPTTLNFGEQTRTRANLFRECIYIGIVEGSDVFPSSKLWTALAFACSVRLSSSFSFQQLVSTGFAISSTANGVILWGHFIAEKKPKNIRHQPLTSNLTTFEILEIAHRRLFVVNASNESKKIYNA